LVQEGIRKSVNGEVYRFHGITERDLVGLFSYISDRTFSATINCGLNRGLGIVGGYGRISQNCDLLPNQGRKGMIFEFDAYDAKGPRSSASYSFDSWYPLNYSRAAMQIFGLLSKDSIIHNAAMADIICRYYLGTEDILFKISPDKGGGYLNFELGKPEGKTILDAKMSKNYGVSGNLDLFEILKRDLEINC
jgi:hypothetical protein